MLRLTMSHTPRHIHQKNALLIPYSWNSPPSLHPHPISPLRNSPMYLLCSWGYWQPSAENIGKEPLAVHPPAEIQHDLLGYNYWLHSDWPTLTLPAGLSLEILPHPTCAAVSTWKWGVEGRPGRRLWPPRWSWIYLDDHVFPPLCMSAHPPPSTILLQLYLSWHPTY